MISRGASAAFAFTDAIFLYEGIDWFRWFVAFWFFLLGLFAGWWRWGFLAEKARHPAGEVDEQVEVVQGGERSPFGFVFASPPDQVDDLTQIHGIGKELAGRLNKLGIYQYWQIAELAGAEVDALIEELDLSGEGEPMEWISRAKGLVEKAIADS